MLTASSHVRIIGALALAVVLACAPIARVKNTQEGYNALEKGDLDAAIQYCTMAANAEPLKPQPQECLGHAYFRADEYERSLMHFEQARQNHSEMKDLDDMLIKLYVKNGERLADTGDTKTAEAMYGKALAVSPDNATVHNNLGVLAMKKEQYEEASKHLDVAVEQDPAFWQAWNNLGLVRTKLGRTDAAFEAFRQAYRITREEASVYTGVANLYNQLDQPFAERRFRRAAARASEDVAKLQQLGGAEMEICLEMAATKSSTPVPNEVKVMRIKAETMATEGNPEKAEDVRLRALKIAPWDVDNRWELAQLQGKMEYFDEAKLTLRCMLEFPLDSYRTERANDLIYRWDVLKK